MMKTFLTIITALTLFLSTASFSMMAVESPKGLILTVNPESETIQIGDEIKFIISMSEASGADLSSFSFRIRLPDGLELKAGSGAIAEGFQNKTGMYMTAFDETPILMVSGFGDAAYNGGAVDVAVFSCIAENAQVYTVDLYDIVLYNINIKPIVSSSVPSVITVLNDSADTETNTPETSPPSTDVNNVVPPSAEKNIPLDGETIPDNTQLDATAPETGVDEWLNPFSDVYPSDWFYDYVAVIYTAGIMVGMTVDSFNPTATVTRAMFAQIFANLDGADLTNYTSSRFSDVPVGHWYTAAIEWAADMGIVQGVGEGCFDPNGNITREQIAVMLERYMRYKEHILPVVDAPDALFADNDEISTWAVDAVKIMQSSGIMSGKPGNLFDPKAAATRAEAAAIVVRYLDI